MVFLIENKCFIKFKYSHVIAIVKPGRIMTDVKGAHISLFGTYLTSRWNAKFNIHNCIINAKDYEMTWGYKQIKQCESNFQCK